MKRKVVKQGNATLMVSLPSEWASKYGIKKGDELEVTEMDKAIMVSTEKFFAAKDIEMNIDDMGDMVMKAIAAIYKAGFDRVKLTFSDPDMVFAIQETSRDEFSGFEIIEQGKRYCVIKKIEEGVSEGFDPVFRRIFLLLLTMAEESLEAIKHGDYKGLGRLKYLEVSNNRMTNYCRRLLTKHGYGKHNKMQFIYVIVEMLELIADQYKYIFDILLKVDLKGRLVSKDIIDCYKDVGEMLRSFYELYYSFDKIKLMRISHIHKRLMSKQSELFKNANKNESLLLHHLYFLETIIFELMGPYLSLNL